MAHSLAIVVSTFPPYRGGMGNAAAIQARLLADRGFTVTVFTPGDPAPDDGVWPFEVRRVQPTLRWGNAAWVPRIAKLVSGFDAVLLHYPFFGAVESFALTKKGHPRLFVYYHMDAIGHGFWRTFFSLHQRIFLPRLAARTRRFLLSSQSYYDHARLGRGPYRATHVTVIPFSVDAKRFEPQPKPPRLLERHHLQANMPIALFVGGLDRAHYFKGVTVLLEAWRRVVSELPHARLVVVGDGDMRAEYERQARAGGVIASVLFAGSVTDVELPLYFALSDVVVLPSIDRSEAFGLVLLEAMASGRATVASALPGVTSVVQDGTTGFLVPPGQHKELAQKLIALLGDESTRIALGRAGRARIEAEYTEDVIGDHLAAALHGGTDA